MFQFLVACAAPDPPPPSGLPSGSPPIATPCAVEQEFAAGSLGAAWRSPTGTLFAAGGSRQARVRTADGTWGLDAAVPEFDRVDGMDGSTDGDVWAFSHFAVFHRDATGAWTAGGPPGVTTGIEGLAVRGPNDVRMLQSTDEVGEYTIVSTPVLWTWDGVRWTDLVGPVMTGTADSLAVLADGTAVIGDGSALHRFDGANLTAIPSPEADRVFAAEDGVTLVAIGSGVAIGDVANGLVSNDPPLPANSAIDTAWATGPDDVWISAVEFDLGHVVRGIVSHWDGAAWTEVVSDASDSLLAITGGDGEVFAVGGLEHELVLRGDAAGMAVDREDWGTASIEEIAVDRETGLAYAIGYEPTLSTWDGSWTGAPFDDRTVRADRIAASAGRVLLVENGAALHVWDGAVWTATETPDVFHWPVAGAEGALFAIGAAYGGEGAPGALSVLREAGSGWEVLDMTGFPVDGEALGAFADGASALWVGASDNQGGALYFWDGTAWSAVVTGLPATPEWISRMDDGVLYFAMPAGAGEGSDPLWQWDGATAAPVPDIPPDVRSAHRLSDGTWYVSLIAVESDELVSAVRRKVPGETWTDVLSGDYVIPLAGFGDTVWAANDDTTWTRTCGL